MALRLQDVRSGSIAYFDNKLLLAEQEIDSGGSEISRPGPFVCVQVKDDRSVWCPVTGEHRPERLLIRSEWRRQGSAAWREVDQFLNDGLNTFLGPNAAFVRAGAKETPFTQYKRPFITHEGIEAILKEIEAQGGPLL